MGFTAVTLASIFLKAIYQLHGEPRVINSDRDSLFLSTFWKELFRLLGTTLAYSSFYHPQTNGQKEVLNCCLEAYLCVALSMKNHSAGPSSCRLWSFGTILRTILSSGCRFFKLSMDGCRLQFWGIVPKAQKLRHLMNLFNIASTCFASSALICHCCRPKSWLTVAWVSVSRFLCTGLGNRIWKPLGKMQERFTISFP
ncbi:UNVERIFIED_CONTAM: hypothetical protein Slati_3703100 [Sesamum latifolium]|uniref:Integrase catalytic domain-containing protein n=1 Tax=Sesamum latifolium TaxID=2727402 RepID=A0AAW2U2R7_9LAMI